MNPSTVRMDSKNGHIKLIKGLVQIETLWWFDETGLKLGIGNYSTIHDEHARESRFGGFTSCTLLEKLEYLEIHKDFFIDQLLHGFEDDAVEMLDSPHHFLLCWWSGESFGARMT